MKRTSLETAEKVISVALSASSCMGFTLFGWFVLELVLSVVTEEHLWICFLLSLTLTYGITKLRTVVKWELYKMLSDELEEAAREVQEAYEKGGGYNG